MIVVRISARLVNRSWPIIFVIVAVTVVDIVCGSGDNGDSCDIDATVEGSMFPSFVLEANVIDVVMLLHGLNQGQMVNVMNEGKVMLHIIKIMDLRILSLNQLQGLVNITTNVPMLDTGNSVNVLVQQIPMIQLDQILIKGMQSFFIFFFVLDGIPVVLGFLEQRGQWNMIDRDENGCRGW